MVNMKSPRSWFLVLVSLVLPSFAVPPSDHPNLAPAASTKQSAAAQAEEDAIRSLINQYFAAYSRKDINAVVVLWSASSPEMVETTRDIGRVLSGAARLEIMDLAIRPVSIERSSATVRVSVDGKLTGGSAAGVQPVSRKMKRLFHLVKESGEWKVWSDRAAEQDLAAAVVAASEEERSGLLAANKELLTPELIQAFRELANRASDKDFRQALSFYEAGARLADEIGDQAGLGNMLSGIGAMHRMRGEYGPAMEYAERALEVREKVGDQVAIVHSLMALGVNSSEQGAYDSGLDYYNRALRLSRQIGDNTWVGYILTGIGQVKTWQGNYFEAIENYQRSLSFRNAAGDRVGAARLLNSIANVFLRQANYDQALEYSRRALALNQSLDDKIGIAMSLATMGGVHRAHRDYSAALEFYQKSFALNQELGIKPAMGNQLHSIGTVHRLQGNYSEALEYLQKAAQIREADGEKDVLADTLTEIGTVLNLEGKPSKALESAARAVEVAREIGARETLWRAQETAGTAYLAMNQPDRALQCLEESVAAIEALRGEVAGGEQDLERFFENKVAPFHDLVGLLVSRSQISQAFGYAERAKARVLLDVLSRGRTSITKAMSPSEREKEQRLADVLASLNRQVYRERLLPQHDAGYLAGLQARLDRARLELDVFQTGLYIAHPELKAQRGQSRPIGLDEAGALVTGPDMVLLEYVVTRESTYLFALTRNLEAGEGEIDIRVYQIPIGAARLQTLVGDYSQRLANRDLDFQQPASELYELLVKPAMRQLGRARYLIIVPDGALWNLPFQALQSSKDHYLTEDFAISYAPSLSVLREMKRAATERNGPATLFAVGNPALGDRIAGGTRSLLSGPALDPLPDAERQVRRLGELYGDALSRVYVGSDAREQAVKAEAGNYSIIHFATHGVLDNASPMYSYIVLSQATEQSGEDGFLEAWEMMNLDLKANLVVLSACETARGRIGQGEGVIGLAWALFVAGCPTTVVSQWNVESTGTSELMLEFHRILKSSSPDRSPSKAEALRQAELKLIHSKQYRHPFFWAPFVMIGNGA